MKCSRSSPKTIWRNIGRGAAKSGYPLEKILTGKPFADEHMTAGYQQGVRKYGALAQAGGVCNVSAPVIPGLTSWAAWDPRGKANRKRWFECIAQAYRENPVDGFSWSAHESRVLELWVQGLGREGWKLIQGVSIETLKGGK